MSEADLDHFRTLVRSRAGIVLEPYKDYLIQSRLGPVAGTLGYASVEALLAGLRAGSSGPAADAAVDAMTTNETYFFRDQTPFDHLRRILVDLGRKGQNRVRIWSAACSTGQEPYSIMMLWDEMAHLLPQMRIELLATDLSDACLARARAGVYTPFEVQRGLPVQKLIKHFEQIPEGWRAKPALREGIQWRKYNLLDSAKSLGRFDIVFCRNVLIYFEPKVRGEVLGRIADQMNPDGKLALGAAETIIGITNRLASVPDAPGLYRVVS